MNFKLNILERIALLNIMPLEGNVVTLKILRELQNQLSFSEAEMKRFKMKINRTPDGAGTFMTWDSDFSTETKEIEIGEVAMDLIAERLKQLESQKRLRMEMLDLYEKFVVNRPSTPTESSTRLKKEPHLID